MRGYSAEEIEAGVRFAWAYDRKLRAYLGDRFRGAHGRRGPRPGNANFVHHVLAAQLARELGAPFDDYVEAHFWWEKRHHGRHPQARHLHHRTGPGNAAEVLAAWRHANQLAPEGCAVADGRTLRTSRSERFATQEAYLAQLCARWGVPRADILRAFGGPDAGVFDADWLRRQPEWCALEAAGHFTRHPGPDLDHLRRRQAELRRVAELAS